MVAKFIVLLVHVKKTVELVASMLIVVKRKHRSNKREQASDATF